MWTRDACVSVQSLLGDTGQNLYVRLTDDVYEDEYEMGMVFLLEEPPITSMLETISKFGRIRRVGFSWMTSWIGYI